jgi:hypothetical protein
VLKDTWIEGDSREGDVLSSLYEGADDEDKKSVEKYFITAICHGDVRTKHNIFDDTANALMRGLKIADHDPLFELQLQQNSFVWISNRVCHSQRYPHKTHYRIVFKEIGITIDRIPSLPGVMTVLAETACGAF